MLIILVVVVIIGATAAIDLARTPIYEASIKILIGQKSQATDNLAGEVAGLQDLALTMTEAVNSRPVAEATIQKLDLQMSPAHLLKNLSAEQIETTQFIQVQYKDSQPERAQLIANTIGEVFLDKISKVSPSANNITPVVWERAVVPNDPVSPNLGRDGLLAVVLGLMVGVGLAFLLEYLDDDWRSPEEVEQVAGVPTFGVIPEFAVSKHQEARNRKRKGD
jgi:capsular polysaccharide biosynthesis protein